MARTLLTSREIGNVQRNDLDITTTGEAVVRKLIAGTNVSFSSTGVDAGTGDVTINVTLPTIDTTIIDGSSNAVTGNAVFDALVLKASINNPIFTGTVSTGTGTTTIGGSSTFTASLIVNPGNGSIVSSADTGWSHTGLLTITGNIALGVGSLALTGSIGATGARSAKCWFIDLESTNFPTVAGVVVPTINSTHTLTNKTIALGSNTVSGTLAQFNTAVTDADLVSLAGTETLTNKTITSPTLSGTVAGTYTLGGTPTFPSTVVLTTATQTLDNKTLTTPNIASILNGVATLTLPVSSQTLVGRTTTDTLTNKTLTDPSNSITATSLRSTTTSISVSAATAPTTGQVLMATSSTAATWQTPSGTTPTGAKVSSLTAVATLAGTIEFPVNDSGISKKLTLTQVRSFASAPTVNNYTTSQTLALNTINKFTPSANAVATLPTAVGNSGQIITVKKMTSAFTLTMGSTSSQTIDGSAASSTVIASGGSLDFFSDGVNWFIK